MLRPEDCIPGTLVECIDAANTILVRGNVYQIEALNDLALDVLTWQPDYAVDLVGVREPVGDCGRDFCAYSLWRFRLLPDERLSIFRQMLAPAPKQKERV